MRISQFQKYSQKENTITNNILLMLSRLNDIKTEYYKSLIQMVTESEDYFPSPNFQQQVGEGEGIIDGRIEIKASKIIIETKKEGKETIDKLLKYGSRFSNESNNYLWHISSEKYNPMEEKEIQKQLRDLCHKTDIHFNNLCFSDLVENLEGIYKLNKHDDNLKLLFEDFSDYCNEGGLIPDYQYKLICAPAGFSYDWNYKHKIFFCPVNYHKQNFTYFGLYRNKSIRTIATVENCILADFDTNGNQLTIHRSTMDKEITDRQKERLKEGLTEWNDDHKGLKYYLFKEDDFEDTDFHKRSKGGIQGYRYMNLKDILSDEQLDSSTEEIANLLREKEWQ